MSSESIFSRIAAGEAPAVRECLDRYGALVWSLARRFSDSEADAEDAAQEIMICLWQNADRFDGSMGSETTFVATIARRRLIDRRRYRERRIRPEPLTSQEYNVAVRERPTAGVDAEGAARHSAAMMRLSAAQQRALRLSIGGLTHEQIATVTAQPLGTVKTNIRRGLIRLRRMAELGTDSAESAGQELLEPVATSAGRDSDAQCRREARAD